MSALDKSYKALTEVLREGAFVNLALNALDEKERAEATRIIYGTLEKYFEIQSILNRLVPRAPKSAVKVILMQGIYALLYMNIPPYAVVNDSVELVANEGMRELKGFVNAILNKVARKEFTLPKEGEDGYEEVKYNLPAWLIEEVKKEYPSGYDAILSATGREEEHVRLAARADVSVFEKNAGTYEKTLTGYFVKNTPFIKDLFNKGLLTYQSYTSTLAVLALGDIKGKKLYDVCAAPGGKSVYAAERGAIVTASDLYPHRVGLIRDYARRMGVTLNAVCGDALVYKKDYASSFDAVLVDAPCSGLGVISKRRDIIFKRSLADIDRLAALQLSILKNCASYVKSGGLLLYSTCTILKKENGGVVEAFLRSNPSFALEELPFSGGESGEMQFLQDNKGTDGFYIAAMRKR